MQVPRWRNLLILKNNLIPTPSQSTMTTQFALIHSTPVSCDKWHSKWSSDGRRSQQPSKNHVRYSIRQKRADTKRALKHLLFNDGFSKTSFQNFDPDHSDGTIKRRQAKHSTARHGGKHHQKKMKHKFRRESFEEDSNEPETEFEARFGHRWYTWSSKASPFRDSEFGFEWKERFSWTNHGTKEWNTKYETDSDDECSIGLRSDRTILGLPPSGPLKIEDVKTAFRLSALKWHPDKHQGPSQAMAEEKFKLCATAYKSLCAALS